VVVVWHRSDPVVPSQADRTLPEVAAFANLFSISSGRFQRVLLRAN
jgi:hypothetical protein